MQLKNPSKQYKINYSYVDETNFEPKSFTAHCALLCLLKVWHIINVIFDQRSTEFKTLFIALVDVDSSWIGLTQFNRHTKTVQINVNYKKCVCIEQFILVLLHECTHM